MASGYKGAEKYRGAEMSTNMTKQKCEDLPDKTKKIPDFIAAAPQDENTVNLLSYPAEPGIF